ncbi:MAG: imidazole glycerol phosphate synthase subunit HisH [Thermoclostridium sp.]|nr:imidazole glycerol phosphate synthase subunit HisH [Thermoclostridium sp.]
MIVIVDYKAGNIRSVEKALQFIGADVVVTSQPELILNAKGVVLPGVGAFADCIGSFRSQGLDVVTRQVIAKGTPFLGICLGYQMLFDYSEEDAGDGKPVHGLGIFKGSVRRIPADNGLKVPHMGWNNLILKNKSPLFSDLPADPYVYFVHSYHVQVEDKSILAAVSRYGIEMDVSISSGKVFGTQFHPEKSGDIGTTMLKNFVKVVHS